MNGLQMKRWLRGIFALVLLGIILEIILCGKFSRAQEPVEFTTAGTYAATPEAQRQLLDDAQQAYRWYINLQNDEVKELPTERFREKLPPLPAFQAAVLMHASDNLDIAQVLVLITTHYKISPEEALEVVERLGEEKLRALGKDHKVVAQKIYEVCKEAQDLILRSLLPVEEILFYEIDLENPSPLELVEAAGVIQKTGRIILARWLLRRFAELETPPSPQQCAEIIEKTGSPALHSLLLDDRLAPYNAQSVETIFTEAGKFWKSQNGIDAAIAKLNSREVGTRCEAETIVFRGGDFSVPKLLAALDDASDDEAKTILSLLASMGKGIRGALGETILNSTNTNRVYRAAQLFAKMAAPTESLPLAMAIYQTQKPDALREQLRAIYAAKFSAIPSRETVARDLLTRAGDYQKRFLPLKREPDDNIVFWHWNSETNDVALTAFTPEDAYRLLAAHYGALAFDLNADDETTRRFFMIAFLQDAVYRAGLDETPQPLETAFRARFAPLTSEEISATLETAIKSEQYAAATQLAFILGETPGAAELLTQSNGVAPLVAATTAANPRLRFAALSSVMKLSPKTPYAGSSFVADALTYFARGEGNDVVLSISPKISEATRVGEWLTKPGLELVCEPAANCHEAIPKLNSPDVLLVVVDSRCDTANAHVPLRDLLRYATRRDIPVAVHTLQERLLSRGRPFTTERRLAQNTMRTQNLDPFSSGLTEVYPTPFDARMAKKIVVDLFQQTGIISVPAPIRLQNARKSLAWITQILEQRNQAGGEQTGENETGEKIYTFENLEELAVTCSLSPRLINQGISLAAQIRTASIQEHLANMVGMSILALTLREKAADALIAQIEDSGLLLRGAQITKIYDRYNASAQESPASWKVQERVIDAIEKSAMEKDATPPN